MELRIGVVGYGMMGRAHCYGYRVAPLLRRLPVTPVVTVMSGRDAAAVAAAGKAVLCEKPLAISYDQARAAATAVSTARVRNAVGFNYRKLPAVALMHRMITEGAVGEVRLWRATWLSDEFTDPKTPFDWRFDRTMGGTTIADLGSHLIDLALWMVGDIKDVCAQSTTFIEERSLLGGRTLSQGVARVTPPTRRPAFGRPHHWSHAHRPWSSFLFG